MQSRSWPRIVAGLITLATAGCTALRDIPRNDFTGRDERKDVRIETSDGLVYEFDFVKVRDDSLVGYKRRDVEGPVDDYATVPLAIAGVSRMSARGVDWKRTSLVAGSAVAVLVLVGLTVSASQSNSTSSSGGGKGGGVP